MLHSLALIVSLLQDPVGGWRGPFWSQESHLLEYELGDFNLDGYPDLVVPMPRAGRIVLVFDGLTGEEIYGYPDPIRSVHGWATSGDVDRDGNVDLIVADWDYPGSSGQFGGRIAAIHGGSGRLLWDVKGTQPGEQIGLELVLQDMNSNGALDLVARSRTGLLGIVPQTGFVRWQRSGFSDLHFHQVTDLNQDGLQELVVLGEQAVLLDPMTGATLWSFESRMRVNWSSLVSQRDLNADGWEDLVFEAENDDGVATLVAVDGRTGGLIWRVHERVSDQFVWHFRFLIEDYTGDGVVDFPISIQELRSDSGTGLALLSGVDGSVVWKRFPGQQNRLSLLDSIDANGDGIHDFVVEQYRAGVSREVALLSGHDGAEVWSTDDLGGYERIEVVEPDSTGEEALFLVSRTHSGGPQDFAGRVVRLDPMTGLPVWELHGEERGEELGYQGFTLVDFDGDGSREVVLVGNGGSTNLRVHQVDSSTGSESWRLELEHNGQKVERMYSARLGGSTREHLVLCHDLSVGVFDPYFMQAVGEGGVMAWQADATAPLLHGVVTLPDQDGDGARELVVIPHDLARDRIQVISGSTGDWQPGLRASSESVSASTGGVVHCDLRFPPDQAGNAYQVLFSFAGTGPTQLGGLLVPLGADRWLLESSLGMYPPRYFRDPMGRLDAQGRASFRMTAAPARLSAQLVGRTMHCAVVSGQVTGQWEFSSASVALEFQP